jgi:CRISPR type III-A-associated RAMP protein Csm4
MECALRIRLLPVTPWRVGAGTDSPAGQDPVYHSDSLFSALCAASSAHGWLDEWLAAAACDGPLVRFSSCFPFLRGLDFVPPPLSLWPPAAASPKVRWKTARFVPLPVVRGLLAAELPAEDRWVVDPASQCLLPLDRQGAAVGPFRTLSRSHASVDRLVPGQVAPHRVDALQFAPHAGLWCVALFRDEIAASAWRPRVEAAFRWLADSGFGGLRSRGFGRCAPPRFEDLEWPFPLIEGSAECAPAGGYWLLSLFHPCPAEEIDWTAGAHSTLIRGGRVESAAGWGAEKTPLTMVAEGSVLAAPACPAGCARDVAPAGFPHPVWRAGFAVAVALPGKKVS